MFSRTADDVRFTIALKFQATAEKTKKYGRGYLLVAPYSIFDTVQVYWSRS